MTTVYVVPRKGGRVRMPDRFFTVMPEEGAHVPRIDYYERLIIGGDLIVSDPPAPLPEPPATSAAETPEPAEEAGSFVSDTSKEN